MQAALARRIKDGRARVEIPSPGGALFRALVHSSGCSAMDDTEAFGIGLWVAPSQCRLCREAEGGVDPGRF